MRNVSYCFLGEKNSQTFVFLYPSVKPDLCVMAEIIKSLSCLSVICFNEYICASNCVVTPPVVQALPVVEISAPPTQKKKKNQISFFRNRLVAEACLVKGK